VPSIPLAARRAGRFVLVLTQPQPTKAIVGCGSTFSSSLSFRTHLPNHDRELSDDLDIISIHETKTTIAILAESREKFISPTSRRRIRRISRSLCQLQRAPSWNSLHVIRYLIDFSFATTSLLDCRRSLKLYL
jgi:hypothetical protein